MNPNRECDALSRYLVGRPCPADVVARYTRAVEDLGLRLTSAERLVWNVACGFRPFLACVDAGVALWHRNGTIRRRLLVMFALLEASPANADRFLFAPRGAMSHAATVLRVLLAPLAMLVGTPLALLCRLAGEQE